MIRSGNLVNKLIFQTRSEVSDGFGSDGTVTWADSIIAWAERWTIAGSERVEAAINRHNAIYRWHIRYNKDILPSMRIKWVDNGTTKYQEIIAINTIGNRKLELEILAEEKT